MLQVFNHHAPSPGWPSRGWSAPDLCPSGTLSHGFPFRIHSHREAFPAASVMFLIDLLRCSPFIPRRLRVRWSTGEALKPNFDYSSTSETMNKLKQWLHYVIITMPVLYVYSDSYEVLSRVGVISSQVLGHLKSSWEAGYSQQEQSMDQQHVMKSYLGSGTFHKEQGKTFQTQWRDSLWGWCLITGSLQVVLVLSKIEKEKNTGEMVMWCSITF